MEKFTVMMDKVFCIVFTILESLFAIFLMGCTYLMYSKASGIDRNVVIWGIFSIVVIISVIGTIVEYYRFKIEVDGSDIHVKDGKKDYSFTVQDIKKVVLRERSSSKGQTKLLCEIKTEGNSVEFNHQHAGFFNMLHYLKRNYDNGAISQKAISSSAYVRLKEYAERCPEGRKHAKLRKKNGKE